MIPDQVLANLANRVASGRNRRERDYERIPISSWKDMSNVPVKAASGC